MFGAAGEDEPHSQSGRPEQCVGNPCDPVSGNKYETQTDVDGSATGLSFTRHYSSLSRLADQGMGLGWSHNHANRITDLLSSSKLLTLEDGRGVVLFWSASGQWRPRSDDDFVLRKSGTQFELDFDSGEQWVFDSQGYLTSRQDVNGRITTIAWSTSGSTQTQTITDPFGHTLTLDYTGDRLTQVTDAGGNTFTYQYDTSVDQRLISVTDPLGQMRS